MNPKVDEFLERQNRWRPEFEKLRAILLDSGLTEDLKWGHPCYALDGKNVALIHGFKEYYAILFHKGALLQDLNASSFNRPRTFKRPAKSGLRVSKTWPSSRRR